MPLILKMFVWSLVSVSVYFNLFHQLKIVQLAFEAHWHSWVNTWHMLYKRLPVSMYGGRTDQLDLIRAAQLSTVFIIKPKHVLKYHSDEFCRDTRVYKSFSLDLHNVFVWYFIQFFYDNVNNYAKGSIHPILSIIRFGVLFPSFVCGCLCDTSFFTFLRTSFIVFWQNKWGRSFTLGY